MQDDTHRVDIGAEPERDEDLITLLYLFALLLCVLVGESAYACLCLIALLAVAETLCNWRPKTECLVPGSELHPKAF